MNKLVLTFVFLFAGIIIVNATSETQNQSGIGDDNTTVKVTVYPNPVVDIIHIAFEKPVEEPIVETFNVNGQKCTPPETSQGDGSNKTEINMSNQPAGIYIIKVFSKGEVIHVQKIIKQ